MFSTSTRKVKHKPSERDVEARLCARIKAVGGAAYKFTSPARRGVPDRLVLMPGDPPLTIFVELKRPGARPTPAQLREHNRLRDLGFRVEVIDSYEGVEVFIQSLFI